jgi:hypothetical protein
MWVNGYFRLYKKHLAISCFEAYAIYKGKISTMKLGYNELRYNEHTVISTDFKVKFVPVTTNPDYNE